MNESDLIKVLQELKVYSQTWKSVSSQDFACQTDFEEVDDNNNNVVPIIYCSQLSLDGDAETQCNIPLTRVICKSCAKPIRVEDASTQCDFTLSPEEEYNASFQKNNQRFNRPIKREKDDDYSTVQVSSFPILHELNQGEENTLSYSDQPDHFPVHVKKEICTSKRIESKNDQNGKPSGSTSSRIEVESNKIMEDFDDHPHDDDAFEDDDPDDEPVSKRKTQLTDSDKELFYSDDERFWNEMTIKRKRIYMKIRQKRQKNRKKKRCVPAIKTNLLNKEKDYLLYVERTESLPQVEGIANKLIDSNFEREMGHIKCPDEHIANTKRDGNWVTDNESDEENEPDMTAFKGELSRNGGENSFLCDICGKQCAKSHVLREHIVKKHSDHGLALTFCYRCVHCKKIYSGEKQLEFHQCLFKGPCEICGVMFDCNGLFWTHRRKHNAVCKICNRTFASMPSYNLHMKSFHEKHKVKIECSSCGRRFVYPSQLRAHVLKFHSNPSAALSQIYKCKECEFSTVNSKSLGIHKGRVHGSAKAYTCNICHESFDKQISLKKHRKIHVDIKCKVCHLSFKDESELTEHESCHSAPENSTQQVGFDAAIQISYPCFPCHEVFVTADDLQTHILSVHDIPSNDIEGPAEGLHEAIHLVDGEEVMDTSSDYDLPVNPDQSTMSISLPDNAVPPHVEMVDIDGILYRVIRE